MLFDRFHLRRTKSWGYLRNGTFDGMIGALRRKEIDIGGTPMFFRQERHAVVSYTTKVWLERNCFIFRHPNNGNEIRNVFLLPFHKYVWLCIGCSGIVIVIELFYIFHVETEGKYVYEWQQDATGSQWNIIFIKFCRKIKYIFSLVDFQKENETIRNKHWKLLQKNVLKKSKNNNKDNRISFFKILFTKVSSIFTKNKSKLDNGDATATTNAIIDAYRRGVWKNNKDDIYIKKNNDILFMERKFSRQKYHNNYRNERKNDNNDDYENAQDCNHFNDAFRMKYENFRAFLHNALDYVTKSILLFLGAICQQGMTCFKGFILYYIIQRERLRRLDDAVKVYRGTFDCIVFHKL